jgi:nitrite reductase/ring-hydroxylating ferredoxin subunit
MIKKILAITVLLLLATTVLAVSACSTQPASAASANSVTAKVTSIKAQLSGDGVTINLSDIDKYTNTRFLVNTATNQLSFMAYKYDNQLYVRADICPPCGSESFTLTKGTLVCDSCGTVFDAKTGVGIKGACVKYAKQPVPFQNNNGTIAMKGTDLTTAFQNTIKPK